MSVSFIDLDINSFTVCSCVSKQKRGNIYEHSITIVCTIIEAVLANRWW